MNTMPLIEKKSAAYQEAGCTLLPALMAPEVAANFTHGRLAPNPNRWSAHMFLHWVSADGPYTAESYDGRSLPRDGDFVFPAN